MSSKDQLKDVIKALRKRIRTLELEKAYMDKSRTEYARLANMYKERLEKLQREKKPEKVGLRDWFRKIFRS